MSGIYPKALSKLIEAFESFPGIGRKMAQRLAFHTLEMDDKRIEFISDAIKNVKMEVAYCSICCNISDHDPCSICRSSRDKETICVVQTPKDVIAMEKTGEFNGSYHVLHGVISPMDGIGPADIRIKELLARLGDGTEEVIIATSPTVEGEATAMYISKLLKPLGIKVTRIAHGVPVGADIEYTDEATLIRALRGRTSI
ncbi:MAG: recombination mediator RecR [Clostridia bacterium]|nr:recombination mediator RecR [Clostridia bacterium]